jgi:hypothetical protein
VIYDPGDNNTNFDIAVTIIGAPSLYRLSLSSLSPCSSRISCPSIYPFESVFAVVSRLRVILSGFYLLPFVSLFLLSSRTFCSALY